MNDWWILVIVVVVGIALVFALIFALSRLALRRALRKIDTMNQPSPPPKGYSQAEENAQVLEVEQTSMIVNRFPAMRVRFALFPQHGPMMIADTTRPFTYAEVPLLVAGQTVRLTFQYRPDPAEPGVPLGGSIRDARIVGPATVEWEGDATVKEAASTLLARIEGSRLIDSQGTILGIERTEARLGGDPVFRYRVGYHLENGQQAEGETYQAARPWLEAQRYEGCTETVQYSATDHQDFILARR